MEALPPDLDVEVVLGLDDRIEVQAKGDAVFVLRRGRQARVGGCERLLLVSGDRRQLDRLDEDAAFDLERALLWKRGDRLSAIDVLVLNRRFERAERDRPVEVQVGRGIAVIVLRVVRAADGENLLRAFLTDVSLIGGLIIAAVDTEGRPSLGWRGRRAAHRVSEAVSAVWRQALTGEVR